VNGWPKLPVVWIAEPVHHRKQECSLRCSCPARCLAHSITLASLRYERIACRLLRSAGPQRLAARALHAALLCVWQRLRSPAAAPAAAPPPWCWSGRRTMRPSRTSLRLPALSQRYAGTVHKQSVGLQLGCLLESFAAVSTSHHRERQSGHSAYTRAAYSKQQYVAHKLIDDYKTTCSAVSPLQQCLMV
jgi:hypothetical protein